VRSADLLTECQNRTTLAGKMVTQSLRLAHSLFLSPFSPPLSLSLPWRAFKRGRQSVHAGLPS